MRNHYYSTGVVLIITILCFSFASSSAAMTPEVPVYLPPCGSDPNANTIMLQDAITQAPNGATLVLPSGVCVLAKCDLAQGHICYGPLGLRHGSAFHIGNKSDLTLVGAPGGASVLKLDPNPPRRADGYHAYCGDTHVLSLQGSTFITLRDFTIDGSDGELPEDTAQCPLGPNGNGKIAERMFDVYVLNSTPAQLWSLRE